TGGLGHNTAQRDSEALLKEVVYRVEGRKAIPQHFELPSHPGDITGRKTETWTASPGTFDVAVATRHFVAPYEGHVPVVKPANHDLTELTVWNADGRLLEPGRDY